MKINLGSCDNLLEPPWLNVDRYDFRKDGFYFQQADLNKPWPWGNSSVAELRAHDIFEHLWPTVGFQADFVGGPVGTQRRIQSRRTDVPPKAWVMNEAHRVLRPGGILSLIVPTTDGRGAFQDPTHVTWWTPNDLFYFCDHWAEWKRFHSAYGITANFKVLCVPSAYGAAKRAAKRAADPWAEVLRGHTTVANDVTKLHVMLEAVK